jgi:hypothetical protein
VVASDLKSGKKLWDLVVFQTKIDPYMEEDVQWVFITSLKFDGDSLIVQDEKSRCYRVNLITRTVEKQFCERTVLIWSLSFVVILAVWLAVRARVVRQRSSQRQQ